MILAISVLCVATAVLSVLAIEFFMSARHSDKIIDRWSEYADSLRSERDTIKCTLASVIQENAELKAMLDADDDDEDDPDLFYLDEDDDDFDEDPDDDLGDDDEEEWDGKPWTDLSGDDDDDPLMTRSEWLEWLQENPQMPFIAPIPATLKPPL